MNIVYGVSGEGLGHASRAKEIIPFLISKGHRVKVLTYGDALPALSKYSPKEIPGINAEYENGKVLLIKSFIKNIDILHFRIFHWRKLKEEILNFSPEVFITDFEPITARLSYSFKKPLISIDNQQEIKNANLLEHKTHLHSAVIAKTVTKSCIPKADYFLVVSMNRHKKSLKENFFLVSPTIKGEITSLRQKKGDFILVYLSRTSEGIIKTLEGAKEKFVIYGFEEKKRKGNLIYKKRGKSFSKDLGGCKAIIATAGFSLISEAVYLKKPYFAIPLKKHFEQYLNAKMVQENKFGAFSENPSEQEIKTFLNNLPNYEKSLNRYKIKPEELKQKLLKILTKIKKNKASSRD